MDDMALGAHLFPDRLSQPPFSVLELVLDVLYLYTRRAADYWRSGFAWVAGTDTVAAQTMNDEGAFGFRQTGKASPFSSADEKHEASYQKNHFNHCNKDLLRKTIYDFLAKE